MLQARSYTERRICGSRRSSAGEGVGRRAPLTRSPRGEAGSGGSDPLGVRGRPGVQPVMKLQEDGVGGEPIPVDGEHRLAHSRVHLRDGHQAVPVEHLAHTRAGRFLPAGITLARVARHQQRQHDGRGDESLTSALHHGLHCGVGMSEQIALLGPYRCCERLELLPRSSRTFRYTVATSHMPSVTSNSRPCIV
jgi:hypothetical protein